MPSLKKNLIIILGSSQGLGAALYDYARQFPENDIVVINRKKKKLPKETTQILLDLSRQLQNGFFPKKLIALLGKRIYQNIYLVNNAATILPVKIMGSADSKKMMAAWNTNLINHSIIINEFIKATAAHKSAAKKILVISSGAACAPHHGLSVYCGAKAGIEMFVRCVFIEQKSKKQTRILAVRPGVINTRMQEELREADVKSFPQKCAHQKLLQKGELTDPNILAVKIYEILKNNAYWREPVRDI